MLLYQRGSWLSKGLPNRSDKAKPAPSDFRRRRLVWRTCFGINSLAKKRWNFSLRLWFTGKPWDSLRKICLNTHLLCICIRACLVWSKRPTVFENACTPFRVEGVLQTINREMPSEPRVLTLSKSTGKWGCGNRKTKNYTVRSRLQSLYLQHVLL